MSLRIFRVYNKSKSSPALTAVAKDKEEALDIAFETKHARKRENLTAKEHTVDELCKSPYKRPRESLEKILESGKSGIIVWAFRCQTFEEVLNGTKSEEPFWKMIREKS